MSGWLRATCGKACVVKVCEVSELSFGDFQLQGFGLPRMKETEIDSAGSQDESGRRKWDGGKRRCGEGRLLAAKRASADAHVHVRVEDYALGPCRLRERAPTWQLVHSSRRGKGRCSGLETSIESTNRTETKACPHPSVSSSSAPRRRNCNLRVPAEVAPRLIETCFPPSSRRTKAISTRTLRSRALQLHLAPSPSMPPL